MKNLFKKDDPRNVNCFYMDITQKDVRIFNILEMVTYVRTGSYKNLPNLIRLNQSITNEVNPTEKAEAVIRVPSVNFGLGYTKDWLEKQTMKPSNLIVFDYRLDDTETNEKLDHLFQIQCVLLSYRNYFNGRTIIVKTDNRVHSNVVWSFENINKFFFDQYKLDNDFDLTSYQVPLRYDPNVRFNPNVVSFGEWLTCT